MATTDRRALLAAGNNADLYQAVFSAQGLSYRRKPFAFVARDNPPPYYSNLTTLVPHGTSEQLAELRSLASDGIASIGVKDSFCRLDLAGSGYRVLVEAAWLWAIPSAIPAKSAAHWQRIETIDALAEWEAGWKQHGSPTGHHMFREAMLEMPEIAFFGVSNGSGFEAGCLANLSRDCVGLSNVFGVDNSSFEAAAALASEFGGGRPIVGYENEGNREQMLAMGFEDVGALRVWINGDPEN